MEHFLLKAATTAKDQGVFEAVISTATVDRDKDIVDPKAMLNALKKWAELGKLVPLAWAHTENVVGHIDPATAKIQNGEVIAQGWIDQGIPLGADAWRLAKSGTLSFSFGYLIPKGGSTPIKGGGLNINELDLFEISVVPVGPANNDTRVLSVKSAEELRARVETVETTDDKLQTELQEVKARLEKLEKRFEDQETQEGGGDGQGAKARSVDPLRKHALDLAKEVRRGGVSTHEVPPKPEEPAPLSDMDADELRKHSRELMLEILRGSP